MQQIVGVIAITGSEYQQPCLEPQPGLLLLRIGLNHI